MLIVMKMDATAAEIDAVVRQVERRGLKAHPIAGAQRTAVGITGNVGALDRGVFDAFPGVLEVIQVSHPYKLVSREFRPDDTVIQVGGAAIGGPELVVIAGPCSVESEEQTLRIARARQGGRRARPARRRLQAAHLPLRVPGARRRGARDPRPRARGDRPADHHRGRPTSTSTAVAEYTDIFQIGARNMQNYSLLKRSAARQAGHAQARPDGDDRRVAARRRVRPRPGQPRRHPLRARHPHLRDHTRNTLDVAAIRAVKRISHLPIIVDPSHAAGAAQRCCRSRAPRVAVGRRRPDHRGPPARTRRSPTATRRSSPSSSRS